MMICVAVVGCSTLPRGAAVQKEILATHSDTAGFAVYGVTKAFLPTLKKWPATGVVHSRAWINHQHYAGGPVAAPNDTLDLVIWDNAENSLLTGPGLQSVALPGLLIGPSGAIFFPYLGSIHVAGMTQEKIRRKIQRMLEETAPSAQVQLRLTPGNRNMVDLVGGVTKPGAYPLVDANYSVLSLITAGGGVAPVLRNPQVRLQRGGRTYTKSLKELYDHPKFDTTLGRGDKVIIEQDTRYFLAQGAAARESLVYFPQDKVSALDAIALMGGVSDNRANPAGILILRNYPAKALGQGRLGPENVRTVFTLDLTTADGLFSAGDFRINPGDTVFVTESPLNNTKTILGLIGSVFGVFGAVSNVGN